MNTKLRGALGLAQKAGKCVSGEFAVGKALSAGRVKLIVLDSGVSEATRKRYRTDCENHGTAYLETEEPGEAIGKPERMILGITDENFKMMIMNAAEPQN